MPFPHISASEPSAFHIRIRTSAFSDGRIRIRPSEPMPKCRLETCLATRSGCSTRSSKPFT